MSDRHNKKKKGKGRKQRSQFADRNISRIDQHKRLGSKLIPPLAQIPHGRSSSWADDHMPEMLWAVLLTAVLERKHYLICLRRIAILCRNWFKRDENEERKPTEESDELRGPNFTVVVDHTKLAEISDDEFNQFISILLKHPLGYAALRPLLLIESLPGLDRWKRVLNVEPTEDDWNTLANGIAGVLDHQSEKSTDIRWLRVILPIISGRLFFPESMADDLESLRLFPDRGDMRHIRPFIRSTELTLRRNPPLPWIQSFWTEILGKTQCIDPSRNDEYIFVETTIDPEPLYAVRYEIVQRFLANLSAKRADARLDSAFGLVLYALAIVEEIGLHRTQTRIIGRLALRALVETNVTLRYLTAKDSDDLWKSYRVYGAGQAKLAFLKALELEGHLPPFLDEAALHSIANEDTWQEFTNIDVGHWANSNLRKLAVECGAKDLYDKYYDWASAYVHGHWGAVRDTNFVTCHNPLHRLHRVPRLSHRTLNSVEADAIDLTNAMVGLVDQLFPGETHLGKLSLVQPTETPTGADDNDNADGEPTAMS